MGEPAPTTGFCASHSSSSKLLCRSLSRCDFTGSHSPDLSSKGCLNHPANFVKPRVVTASLDERRGATRGFAIYKAALQLLLFSGCLTSSQHQLSRECYKLDSSQRLSTKMLGICCCYPLFPSHPSSPEADSHQPSLPSIC